MGEANIDILCIQETRSLTNHRITDTIADSRSEFLVLEAPNTQCHTHGGVAIIYKKHVQLKLIGVDNETIWWDTLTEIKKNRFPKNQITGRWIHVEVKIGTKKIDLINHYFPSSSTKARDIHVKQIQQKWTHQENVIMTGDWNFVIDLQRDIFRTKGNSKSGLTNHEHQIQELQMFYENHNLVDKYIDAYDSTDRDLPIYMTHRTQHTSNNGMKQTTLTRIDRIYVSQNLCPHTFNLIDYKEDTTTPNYIPTPITTTHSPIGIALYDPTKPRIKQFKLIWRCNMEQLVNDKRTIEIIMKLSTV